MPLLCLTTHLSAYLSPDQSICLYCIFQASVYLDFYLSIPLPTYFFVYRPIHLPIYPFLWYSTSHLSVYVSILPWVYLSNCKKGTWNLETKTWFKLRIEGSLTKICSSCSEQSLFGALFLGHAQATCFTWGKIKPLRPELSSACWGVVTCCYTWKLLAASRLQNGTANIGRNKLSSMLWCEIYLKNVMSTHNWLSRFLPD